MVFEKKLSSTEHARSRWEDRRFAGDCGFPPTAPASGAARRVIPGFSARFGLPCLAWQRHRGALQAPLQALQEGTCGPVKPRQGPDR